MKRILLIIFLLGIPLFGFSQVGINTTDPKAQLEIKSGNQATPSNTDGILIPKIDAFPVTNPTAAQNSMLVYLTTTSAGKTPGFYYWDSTATPQWRGFGATIPNGTAVGNTMYWNGTTWVNNSNFLFNDGTKVGVNTPTPSSTFTVRQDGVGITQESSSAAAQVGFYTAGSNAYVQTHSNSDLSFATNNGSTQMLLQKATGNVGIGNPLPGTRLDVKASTGPAVVTAEYSASVDGSESSVFNAKTVTNSGMTTGKLYGLKNDLATSNGVEFSGVLNNITGNGGGGMFGVNNKFSTTSYAIRYGIANYMGAASGQDTGVYNQLFGPGLKYGIYNDIHGSQQPVYGMSNRFNGPGTFDRHGSYNYFEGSATGDWFGNAVHFDYTTTTGATGKRYGFYVMIPPSVGGSEHYGVYSYAGNLSIGYSAYLSGRVSIGSDTTLASHYILPLTRGTNGQIMRTDGSGNVSWVAPTTIASGTLDQAYDFGGAGLGNTIIADAGAVTIAGTDGIVSTGTSGAGATVPAGAGVRMVWNPRTGSFRAGIVTGTQWDAANIGGGSTAFGYSTRATGNYDTAFGAFTSATGSYSTAWGAGTTASGHSSTAFGNTSVASGGLSTAFGVRNTASTYGETVLGIGATTYTPSINGATEFRPANATDRLFVIGNAIDTDGNDFLDVGERSDAMVVLKNGNTGIGNSAPALARLQVQGVVGNTVAMFNRSANSQGLSLVSDWPGVYFNCYYNGGTRSMAGSGFASILNTDQSTGGFIFQTTNVANTAAGSMLAALPTRMTIQGNGNVGIGAIVPNGQFELSLDQGRKPGTSTWTITSDERLKTIHGNYSKGLEEIIQLQPITYNYVNSGKRVFDERVLDKEFSGFSAQEVQKIFPEAVNVDDDGFLNFNIHPILVASVNAFKELDIKNKAMQMQIEQIKTQQKEIDSLKAINSEILKRLENLEKK